MKWLLKRLREPSTWRGLVWLATVAGLSLRPDQAEAIVTVGMALAGLLGVFLPDEHPSAQVELPPIDLQGRPGAVDVARNIGAVQPVNQLRQPLSPQHSPESYSASDPNTYPRMGGNMGFGDRD